MFTVARAASAMQGWDALIKCSACDMELAERHGADWPALSKTYQPPKFVPTFLTFRNVTFYTTHPRSHFS